MAVKDFLKKVTGNEQEPQQPFETGTKDKVLDSLRQEEIRFQETDEKEGLKEKLRQKKQQLVRENVFGVKGGVEDVVDINNPKVNINKTSVDLMRQKNLMKGNNLLNDPNRIMTKSGMKGGDTILNQPNLISSPKGRLKRTNIKFL